MTEPIEKDELRYRVRSVERAIDLLKVFTQEVPEHSLAGLAAAAGLSKPTALRILTTLAAGGLVSQHGQTGRYSLGSEIAALAAIRARQSPLLDRALPSMRAMRDDLDETVSLAIRVGDYRVHLYQLESLQTLRRTTAIGDRSPLYAGAANKLLLSAMDDVEIDAYLDRTELEAFTPRTITTRDELMEELRTIRAHGFAESRGEHHAGGAAVAAPVRDASGAVVAVVYVSVPASRYADELRARCRAAVIAAGASISRDLGYRDRTGTADGTDQPVTRGVAKPAKRAVRGRG
jgi:DNA-binding IclR family transcriptional regulator